jgi:hypothetical protein
MVLSNRFYSLTWCTKFRNGRIFSFSRSLEAENLFGEFQDLDPKGVGVLRPDDIPIAMSTACELLSVRMDAKKSFFSSDDVTEIILF